MDIDMDIKELEAFVYVVENCSFSRAAELLHLTQPTISSHVSALERKLNIKLIVRTTKETPPTRASSSTNTPRRSCRCARTQPSRCATSRRR